MIIEHIARMFRYVCVCARIHVSIHVWYVFVGLCVRVCVWVCVQSKITEFNYSSLKRFIRKGWFVAYLDLNKEILILQNEFSYTWY